MAISGILNEDTDNQKTIIYHTKKYVMRTFQNIRKRLKSIAQRQNMFSDLTVNSYNNENKQIMEIHRYSF